MLKLFFLTVIVFGSLEASAQDLIVTKENDSINAKITKEDKKSIYFYFLKNGEPKSTLLLREQVAQYQKDYFRTSEVPENFKKPEDYEGNRFRFGIEVGFGYRAGRLQDDLDPAVKDYLKKLRPGLHLGADAHYFINEHLAFGTKYSFFHSSASNNNLEITFPDGTIVQGGSTQININYIGPSMLTRFISANERNAFITQLSLGYLGYSSVNGTDFKSLNSTGSTFGINADIGYDIGLTKNLALGFNFSMIMGSLQKLTIEGNGMRQTIDLKESGGETESLGHFNLSIGLRVNI